MLSTDAMAPVVATVCARGCSVVLETVKALSDDDVLLDERRTDDDPTRPVLLISMGKVFPLRQATIAQHG
jgi:hypothetical protein